MHATTRKHERGPNNSCRIAFPALRRARPTDPADPIRIHRFLFRRVCSEVVTLAAFAVGRPLFDVGWAVAGGKAGYTVEYSVEHHMPTAHPASKLAIWQCKSKRAALEMGGCRKLGRGDKMRMSLA